MNRMPGLSPMLRREHIPYVYSRISKLAGQEGLEPPTLGFGDRYSAN